MAKIGRPTTYCKELVTDICNKIADGKSLRSICKSKKMPNRKTVHSWLLDADKKDFYLQYEQATAIRAENMFDELEEIADNKDKESVQRDRLRTDIRKWKLSKMLPKKFGDKLDLTTGGEKLPTPIIPLNRDE